MKKYWTIISTLCIAVAVLHLSPQNSFASRLALDATLNEMIVMIPAGHSANFVTPGITLAQGISSGANPSDGESSKPAPNTALDSHVMLETTIFKPTGDGPFPILLLNHGKSLGDPHQQERARFLVISREFVKRGYAVVIPMRTGFGKSSGKYFEQRCDMTTNGHLQAHDLVGVLRYTLQQKWAGKDRILIAGQSYGGLATMAFGTRNFPGVKGLINFAGGLRTGGSYCNWQSSLIDAFANYGSKTSLPSIWFYGENDSYFNTALATRFRNAYVNAGGNAKLIGFGPFKRDAHGMSSSRDGVKIWWPEVEKFLTQIGMPTKLQFPLAEKMHAAKSNFAAIDNINAVPFLQQHGREEYQAFLTKSLPRAFALSSTGAWSWVEDGDDPVQHALTNCSKVSRTDCTLYAVDNDVVWTGTPTTPTIASYAAQNQGP